MKIFNFIFSFKWLKQIKELIDLDQTRVKQRQGWIPILNDLDIYCDVWNDTIGKGKGFDSFYNETKRQIDYYLNLEPTPDPNEPKIDF